MDSAKLIKSESTKEPTSRPETLADKFSAPPENIIVLTEQDSFNDLPRVLIENLRSRKKRDWFVPHAYFCLPLVMGNQCGFVVKALYNFKARWDGGAGPTSVLIEKDPEDIAKYSLQIINSHFGMGTITIQNRWSFRTPKGVNLLICNPPNYFIDGIIHMAAVVEADNLRRDFTFNLRITRPNHWIEVNAGEPIGCVIPYPRHFIDHFEIKLAQETFNQEVIDSEREAIAREAQERCENDPKQWNGLGFRYFDGEDVFGNKFSDHQKSL